MILLVLLELGFFNNAGRPLAGYAACLLLLVLLAVDFVEPCGGNCEPLIVRRLRRRREEPTRDMRENKLLLDAEEDLVVCVCVCRLQVEGG